MKQKKEKQSNVLRDVIDFRWIIKQFALQHQHLEKPYLAHETRSTSDEDSFAFVQFLYRR